ncbi:MAG: ATP-grasp domain-containing protein [Cellulomonas iranensis]|uniref:ATP-grasp domain-containing protein n=1 Tax=Cellulomonas iranensis TaxID=76862 RepID=UPI001B0E6470|nr:ATP-grasp domain-containing protein [Cellulomonas iranensis]MBO9568486.1 ATP-grasp domain-containing protein [Cellulomonas iranensis]
MPTLNVLVVGYGVHRSFGLRALRGQGHTVGVVDDVAHVPVDFVDWYHPLPASSVADPVALAEASGVAWDVVLCWGEYSLREAVRFAEALGLPGPRLDVDCFRDKSLMRARLAQAGLRVPAYTVTDDPQAASRWAKELGRAVVVKPVDYAGSSGVTEVLPGIDAEAAARAAIGKSFTGRCVVEELITGAEVSIESVTWDGREHVTYAVTEKRTSARPYFVETGHIVPAALDDAVNAEVVATVHAALDAFGMERGPSHGEVILTDGGPVVVEIAGRLGGDLIPVLVHEATGVNLYLEELDAIAGADRAPATPTARATSAVRFLEAPAGTRVTWPSTGVTAGTVLESTLRDLEHWYPHYVDAPVVDGAGRRLGYALMTGTRADVMTSYKLSDRLAPPVSTGGQS